MEVVAMLADSVQTAEGKLQVQGGGWNIIWTQVTPARHPRIGVAAVIRVPWTATNTSHRFELRLEDQDGTLLPIGTAPPGAQTEDGKIRKVGGEFTVGRPPGLQPGDEQLVPLAINIDGLEFERADAYMFVLSIDGTDVEHLRFRVQKAQSYSPIIS